MGLLIEKEEREGIFGKFAIFFFLTKDRTEEGRKGLDDAMGSGAPRHGGGRG